MQKVNRLGWAGTRSFRLHDWHVGVRSADAETDRALQAILARNVTSQRTAPPNFSLRLDGEEEDGDRHARIQLLYHACTLVVRTRSRDYVIRELIRRLDEETRAPTTFLELSATAFVGPADRAVLLPTASGRADQRWQEQLQAAGWRRVPGRISDVEPDTGALVVKPPGFPVADHSLAQLASTEAGDVRECAQYGRYRVAGWVFADRSGHDELTSAAHVLERATQLVINSQTMGRVAAARGLTRLLTECRPAVLPREQTDIASIVGHLTGS
jgi:hypothetical protein